MLSTLLLSTLLAAVPEPPKNACTPLINYPARVTTYYDRSRVFLRSTPDRKDWRNIQGSILNGRSGMVLQEQEVDQELWYLVEFSRGANEQYRGWIRSDYLAGQHCGMVATP